MSGLDRSTEIADELVLEAAKEDEPGQKALDWHNWVGLSTLVLALLVGVGALLAGITAHEALLKRTQEAIEASDLAGDRVAVEVLRAKHEILLSLGETPNAGEIAEIQAYEQQMSEHSEDMALDEKTVAATGYSHLILAIGVTILSVGITLCGMSVVVEQRRLWFAGLAVGAVGAIGLGIGIASMIG